MTLDEQREADARGDVWVLMLVLGVYVVLTLIALWAVWMALG